VKKLSVFEMSQERIVLLLAIALLFLFSVSIDGFLQSDNILSIIQSVSVLGILGIAMAISIIGRGIDLSVVAIMAYSVAWTLALTENGMSLYLALLLGLGFAICAGLVNGYLIAYAEIPAIFATLASGTAIYGFGQYFLVSTEVIYLPTDFGGLEIVGSGRTLGIPNIVFSFAVMGLAVWLLLQKTVFGRYLYAMGDNPAAARSTGIATRPLIVAQYVLSAVIGFIAGLVTATAVASMNTRVVNSTLVYDVILVAVIGGVSLSGGRGNIRNVLVGTILIGILLNGMTMLNMPYTAQNIIKGAVLLIAIIADSYFNPRDEQTSQHGDI
jgi:ribose transport system permease protein